MEVLGATEIPSQRRFALKYAIDRVLALLALLVLAPVLLAITLTVRLSSPGPVLFRQRRVGLGGRIFNLYKFRTMVEEPAGPGFIPADGLAPGGVEGADRRTWIGRLLRASSVDELPQLVNVLRGEMSLIGPRPERPEYVRRFSAEIPRYFDRHRVKCGITGWAQASGLRGQTSIADRAAFDNYYIDNWSLRLELRTLALTVIEVLRCRDGRPSPHGVSGAPSASIAARVVNHRSRNAATAASSTELAAGFPARALATSCAAASASA